MFVVENPKMREVHSSNPEASAAVNSLGKALSVEVGEGDVVVACDTIVACYSKEFGKPGTPEKAARMLRALRGRWHSVFTGVTILSTEKQHTFCVESKVKLKSLTDEEIDAYIKEYDPLDKAGAYGIQDGVVVEEYSGDFDNIVGMPVYAVRRFLKEYGVNVKEVSD